LPIDEADIKEDGVTLARNDRGARDRQWWRHVCRGACGFVVQVQQATGKVVNTTQLSRLVWANRLQHNPLVAAVCEVGVHKVQQGQGVATLYSPHTCKAATAAARPAADPAPPFAIPAAAPAAFVAAPAAPPVAAAIPLAAPAAAHAAAATLPAAVFAGIAAAIAPAVAPSAPSIPAAPAAAACVATACQSGSQATTAHDSALADEPMRQGIFNASGTGAALSAGRNPLLDQPWQPRRGHCAELAAAWHAALTDTPMGRGVLDESWTGGAFATAGSPFLNLPLQQGFDLRAGMADAWHAALTDAPMGRDVVGAPNASEGSAEVRSLSLGGNSTEHGYAVKEAREGK
jgi:hypothetical protein